VTLREETEWTETLENGCNQLAGAEPGRIRAALGRIGAAGPWTDCYGDGEAAHRILDILQSWPHRKGETEIHG
jgi:UDP-GlcNAc3NAcA epimerase